MLKQIRVQEKGFTLIELAMSMGILLILSTLVTLTLVHTQHTSSLTTTITSLVTDLKQQQIKAMIGDTQGSASSGNYGIYFEQNKYTLFHGSSYSASDSANFSVALTGTLEFGTSGESLVFSPLSGEVMNYTSPLTITVLDTSNNEQKTLTINRYGTISQVQ